MSDDRHKIYGFLNTLNSVQGYYRHKRDKDKHEENIEHYFERAQKIIWDLLEEIDKLKEDK